MLVLELVRESANKFDVCWCVCKGEADALCHMAMEPCGQAKRNEPLSLQLEPGA
jgi:hypothetical protein